MEEEKLVIERRITLRVFNYWEMVCRGRPMPEESDIDPDALGADWENCFLLQTRDIDHIEQFNFTYLGEGILRAYQHAGINPENLYLVGPNAFYLAPQFKQVVENAKPIIDEGYFFEGDGTKILYRQCLLPIGAKPKKVEAIFGAMLFKAQAAKN